MPITEQLLKLMGEEYVLYITGASAREIDLLIDGSFDNVDLLETVVFTWTIYERLYMAVGKQNAIAWLKNHRDDIKAGNFNEVSQAARHWIENK